MEAAELNSLMDEFREFSVKPSISLLLLRPRDALECIRRGLERGHRLLGVDGFHLLPSGAIQPEQELSVDEHHYTDVHEFVREVCNLLGKEIDNERIAFEVVFDD